MVIGDSLADWLAYGLDEFYTDHPEIGFERKISATSGLIRYDAKNDRLDWSQITKDSALVHIKINSANDGTKTAIAFCVQPITEPSSS